MTRICVTEVDYDRPEAVLRRRFAAYKALGVDTIRVQTGWLDRPAFVRALRGSSLKIKMILYVLGMSSEYAAAHPSDRMVDEHGVADRHLGPWNADRAETALQTGRAEMEKLAASGLAGRVTELVADLGPAGEGIYPANWTVNDRGGEEAYWCYSSGAQESFRVAMRAKYGSVDTANCAWGVMATHRFESWDRVAIPAPRTGWARGAFWNDMLTWYRDSKRRMILERIEQTRTLARSYLGKSAGCIVYLPGYAYSQSDWDAAVKEASGPPSIRLMMDNDWLMATAIGRGCVLQYTGVENVGEVRNIVRKLKAAGSDAYASMWGENAGNETAGRNPVWLAEVVMSTGIRGVDLTWSNWLFEKDGLTPSATYGRFAHAARMIRTYYAIGRRLAPYPPGEAARPTAPGSWTLACVDSTRLMGSFPDVIKGNDPEIAAVEGAQTQRMLLRFPMELLPAGRRIRRARLVLKRFRNYDDSGSRAVLGIYRVTQPWSGLDADWRHATAGTLWTRPGGTAVDKRGCPYVRGSAVVPWASAEAAPFTKAGDIVAFDVTTLCREMAMVANYGMMIVVDGPRNANESFGSQAHPDPGMRPALYVEPGPAPAIARAASVFVAPARSTVIPW